MKTFGHYEEYKEEAEHLQKLQQQIFDTYAKEKELKEVLANLKPDNPHRKTIKLKLDVLFRSRKAQCARYLEELNKKEKK